MKRSPLLIRALALLLLLGIGIAIAYRMLRPHGLPPIYGPRQINPALVDPATLNEQGEHHISDFRLTDQNGRSVTLADVRGHVLLVDFFFTTCASICPKMAVQMERVQHEFADDDRVLLLSHTVTPEIDSVPRMFAYAQLHHADPRRWRLLTGDRAQIYKLARTSYFAAKTKAEKPSEEGGPNDFVHTENFVLVDTLGRLRGFYDGTSSTDVDRAMRDMHLLLEASGE